MEPLHIFIAKVRLWHVVTAGAFALLFVIVSYLTDDHAFARAVNLQLAIHSIIAIPVMIFTLAFLIFAMTTRQFRALTLFPSIFLVIAIFAAVAIIGSGMEDPDFATAIFIPLGLSVSLGMSGLLCAIIAIRRKFGR